MKQVIKFLSKDAKLFDTKHDCLKHEFESTFGSAFDCPLCKATGEIEMKNFPIYESKCLEEDQGWNGWHSAPVYRYVLVGYKMGICVKCNGLGFTTEELKPVTETIITGYE